MPEAEDVITDAARHATIFARQLWERHRPKSERAAALELRDVADRLDLLVSGAFGVRLSLRVAQPPAPATFLARLFKPGERPRPSSAVPATDGVSIWLPASLGDADPGGALRRFRCMALQQGMRAVRGSALYAQTAASPLVESVYLLLEARAADAELARLLPGMKSALAAFRADALSRRPPLDAFPAERRALESLLRSLVQLDVFADQGVPFQSTPHASLEHAQGLAVQLLSSAGDRRRTEHAVLFPDLWTGQLKMPPGATTRTSDPSLQRDPAPSAQEKPRSAQLARRPDIREPNPDEDDPHPGAWMVQTTTPHEQVEDPIGMQRPTDRDEQLAAEEYADALSELREARLVTTPGKPKELLLTEDGLDDRGRPLSTALYEAGAELSYPEWDFRSQAYRTPGATVRLVEPALGSEAWVARTLREHRSMHDAIRRRFEMLRAHRERLRKQQDGEDIDLEAYVEAYADFHAGRPMPQGLYQSQRRVRRELAVSLLIDVSGSTDSWVSANRRVIDVEREALLLVCVALEAMHEPYNVLAFSGEGPSAVTVASIKGFDERHGAESARRIAALEPERYTRAGAAIRHASALLMQKPARHRLLLLLSDGKPNDVDEYEGRYGIEDMKRAVVEARLQGIFPFCLTIDRSAARYLPDVFGPSQYALLPRPELLPSALLDWMRRLSSH